MVPLRKVRLRLTFLRSTTQRAIPTASTPHLKWGILIAAKGGRIIVIEQIWLPGLRVHQLHLHPARVDGDHRPVTAGAGACGHRLTGRGRQDAATLLRRDAPPADDAPQVRMNSPWGEVARRGELSRQIEQLGAPFDVTMHPFQIIFNPTSAAELSKLPKDLQLQILGEFRGLPEELRREEEIFGHLAREGRTLTRYRLGDYRVYFERHPLGVVVHRILSRNTLKDFLYRSSLPTGEDQQLQDNPRFWDLIEAAKSAR